VQVLSKEKKEEQAYASTHKDEILVAKKLAIRDANRADEIAAVTFLKPWQRQEPPKKKRCRSKASLDHDAAAAAAALALPTPAVPAKGISALPVGVWHNVVEFLGACGKHAIRGATAASIDMAAAALVCTDIYAATVQVGWRAIAAGLEKIERFGDTDDERATALECILHNPLKANLENIQTALRILRLPVSGKKAVVTHRLLEVCTLRRATYIYSYTSSY
jgi:hypothetical protein